MTYQELQDCRHAAEYIADMGERMRRLESQIERITGTMELAKCYRTGEPQDKMAGQIAKLLDWRDEYWDAMLARRELVRRLEAELEQLPWSQRRIMALRYIDALGWRQVAQAAHYDRSRCFALHKAALDALKIQGQDPKRPGTVIES